MAMSFPMRRVTVLAGVLVLGACAETPVVPKTMQGDIPVKLVNDTNSAMYQLTLRPADASPQTPMDRIPFSLERKSSSILKFKQGAYMLGVDACDFFGMIRIELTGPVEVHISRKKSTASPQHGHVTLVVRDQLATIARAAGCYAQQGGAQQGAGPAGSERIPQCDESGGKCTADGFVQCYGKSCCTLGPGHLVGGQEVCGD
jgi:hypothetical protein